MARREIPREGQCEEQVSPIKIMRNVGTYAQQDWQEQTYQIPSGCKCAIKPGPSPSNDRPSLPGKYRTVPVTLPLKTSSGQTETTAGRGPRISQENKGQCRLPSQCRALNRMCEGPQRHFHKPLPQPFHSVLPRDIHSIALFRGPSTAVEEARVTSYPSFSVFFLVRIYRSRSFVDAAVVVRGLLYLDLDPSQRHSGSGAEA
ncbi:hypothetical protein Bbelb_051500 [Branchiostoma belcheri]|nr:hypothetical protein Bbelb_051500 [Branchiostoma belcheri]